MHICKVVVTGWVADWSFILARLRCSACLFLARSAAPRPSVRRTVALRRSNDIRHGGVYVCMCVVFLHRAPTLPRLSGYCPVVRFGPRATSMDWPPPACCPLCRGVRRRRATVIRRSAVGRPHRRDAAPLGGARYGAVRRQRLRFNYKIRSLPGVRMTLVIDCSRRRCEANAICPGGRTMDRRPASRATLISVVRRTRIDRPGRWRTLSPSLSLSPPHRRVCSYTRAQWQPFT